MTSGGAAWWRFLPAADIAVSLPAIREAAALGLGAQARLLREGRARLGSGRTAQLLRAAKAGEGASSIFGPELRLLLVTAQQPQPLVDALEVGFAIAGFRVRIEALGGLTAVASALGDPASTVFDSIDLTLLALTPAGEDEARPEDEEAVASFAERLSRRTLSPVGIAEFDLSQGQSDGRGRNTAPGVDRLFVDRGETPIFDMRFARSFGALLTANAADRLADVAAGWASRLMGRAPKLLVTDLDGTLWAGVLGEGCLLGPPRPALHMRYAQALAALRRRGVVLAVASRNDPADVDAAFAHAKDWPVSAGDFAAVAIGWNDKASLVGAALTRLGLSAEHAVFIDDDPVNCGKVAAHFPNMDVRIFAGEEGRFAAMLLADPLLAGGPAGDERALQYRRKADVDRLRSEAPDFGAFLARLRSTITIEPLSAYLIPRAAELAARVNQFILTAYRPNVIELAARRSPLDFLVRLDDAFGAHGLVGLVLASIKSDTVTVDNLFLSCRALERGVEHAILTALCRAAAEHGAASVGGLVDAMPRNAPARDWLAAQGASDHDGRWVYPVSGRAEGFAADRPAMPVAIQWSTAQKDERS